MLRLAADTVTAFSARPLYGIMYLGAAVSLLGAVCAVSVVARYCVTGHATQGWASLMTAVTFFSGLILFSLGVIGQYVARIFEEAKERPMYIVAETVDVLSRPEVPRRLRAGVRGA